MARVMAAALALGLLATPGSGQTEAGDARAAFERLRTLAGTWGFQDGGQRGSVVYELVSGGTVILERVMSAEHGPVGMVSMIRLDGDRLVLDHYCTAGNQPRLVSPGLEAGEIRFSFAGATSLPDTAVGHIHGAVFQFPTGQVFRSLWTWREHGVETTSERRHWRRQAGS